MATLETQFIHVFLPILSSCVQAQNQDRSALRLRVQGSGSTTELSCLASSLAVGPATKHQREQGSVRIFILAERA